jgi:Zn-dependent peptidase ImmA (M78 family)
MRHARIFANVRPQLLQWARETAGYPVAAAAKKLKMKTEKLTAVESGTDAISIPKLRDAAKLYHRPLAAFFLPAPPPVPPPVHDFRIMSSDEEGDARLCPALQFELRRARRRRTVALNLMNELELPVTQFTLQASVSESPEAVAGRARDWLHISVAEQRAWREDYAALHGWIGAIERRGTLVFQSARVPLSVMRGFSIPESVLPVIVLNGKDRPRARVFSAMHELVHLMLREGGICDPMRADARKTQDSVVETFCNRVAGAILVPSAPFMAELALSSDQAAWDDEMIRALADAFVVSREVIVLRLRSIGRASDQFVSDKLDQYQKEYIERAISEKEKNRESGKKIVVPVDRTAVRNNGRRYTSLVLDALERERITFADAAEYLGVRVKHFERISDIVRGAFDEAV